MKRKFLVNSGERGWVDVDPAASVSDFANKLQLSEHALSVAADVLLLPLNTRLTDYTTNENLFPLTTKPVRNALSAAGLGADLYDDGRERSELVLRSANVLFPILLFAKDAAVSVGLGILASLIYDRWKNAKHEQPDTLRVEYAVFENGQMVCWRRIEGSPSHVQQLLVEESARREGSLGQRKSPRLAVAKRGGRSGNTMAKRFMKEGRALIAEAELVFQQGDANCSEALYRRSLHKIRDASLVDPENSYHRIYLHHIGRRIHSKFSCPNPPTDGSYTLSCPVLLSHTKGGFSIGGSAKPMCSICCGDAFTCPHEAGQIYDGVVAKRVLNTCNICGKETCGHLEGQVHDQVEAYVIISHLTLDHISYVENPEDPLCCIQSRTMGRDEVWRELSPDERRTFKYGETVLHCHHCLICKGS